ncbi:acyl-CoA dehydrogenase family protein [Streptomyces sp. NPDC058612]|uniref:acyl-CoA dehydrogenase family protein n=1 Tax=Streptomyces sp. NPDC058612 TaxID=3346555 RepID=UPI003664E9D5
MPFRTAPGGAGPAPRFPLLPVTGAQRHFLPARLLLAHGRPDLVPFFAVPNGAVDPARPSAAADMAACHPVMRTRPAVLGGVPALRATGPEDPSAYVTTLAGAGSGGNALRAALAGWQPGPPARILLIADFPAPHGHGKQQAFPLVVANAGPGDGAHTAGATAFVVSMRTHWKRIGHHLAEISGEPAFKLLVDEVRLGADAAVSGEPEIGVVLSQSLDSLTRGRFVVPSQCNGIAEYARGLSVAHARERRAFGALIDSYQHVQEHLVSSRAEVETAKLLTLACARLVDAGTEMAENAAPAKLVSCKAQCGRWSARFRCTGRPAGCAVAAGVPVPPCPDDNNHRGNLGDPEGHRARAMGLS